MNDERFPVPAHPVNLTQNSAPRNIARIVDNPQDEADEQMGLMIRDAALAQEATEWLLTRTRVTEEQFSAEAMQGLARVARTAKAVNDEFSSDDDIDKIVRGANKNTVVSLADSLAKQQTALTELNGEIGTQMQNLTTVRGKIAKQKLAPPPQQVIVQAGPKLKPAPLFTTEKKYIIDRE